MLLKLYSYGKQELLQSLQHIGNKKCCKAYNITQQKLTPKASLK